MAVATKKRKPQIKTVELDANGFESLGFGGFEALGTNHCGYYVGPVGQNGFDIAELQATSSRPISQQEKYAKLFAAAPYMLLALQRIRNCRDEIAEHGEPQSDGPSDDQGFDDWAADLAERAIDKALNAK